MKSCLSMIGLGVAVFAFFGLQPAAIAGCQLITATHSARSQAKAVADFTSARPPERL